MDNSVGKPGEAALIRVAVPAPFADGLDYSVPDSTRLSDDWIGCRVKVPLGRRTVVGVVIAVNVVAQIDHDRLKAMTERVDDVPIFDSKLWQLLLKMQRYYHRSYWDVIETALPKSLLKDKPFCSDKPCAAKKPKTKAQALALNAMQQAAYDEVIQHLNDFFVMLLDGVTGSGKTEVYLQVIEQVLRQGKQALVLVPEISLTPQMLERFSQRFDAAVIGLHSHVTPVQKKHHWVWAATGQARIVVGTRSALFTPFQDLGVIIVDEEHDLSYKQQSGVRYHARDMAIMRAQLLSIPVILGSATPSLEALDNAHRGRFSHVVLPKRAGQAVDVRYHVIDMRQQPLQAGLSKPLIEAMQQHLARGKQVLLFLNRRGYAPVWMCHHCSWIAHCDQCDVYYTYYQKPLHLACHHCGKTKRVMTECERCHADDMIQVGVGTEKVEEALTQLFPEHAVVRIDRSSTSRKGELDALLSKVQRHEADILIGTQMLAKGHHFPDVTMVGIIDVDTGLFSVDFRALERLGQLIVQVAGRAGREAAQGDVYLQTHQSDHPLLQQLLAEGYPNFARQLLSEREQAGWPPYAYLALLHAEGQTQSTLQDFLAQLQQTLSAQVGTAASVMGPITSSLPKKAGYHRMQLLIQAQKRPALHMVCEALLRLIDEIKPKKIRWSLDVDPMDQV